MESPRDTPGWRHAQANTPLYGVTRYLSGTVRAENSPRHRPRAGGRAVSGSSFSFPQVWGNNTVNAGNPATICKFGNKLPVLTRAEIPDKHRKRRDVFALPFGQRARASRAVRRKKKAKAGHEPHRMAGSTGGSDLWDRQDRDRPQAPPHLRPGRQNAPV
jgi:hypothetical protein